MKKHTDFTEGRILGPLLLFVMPVLFALFLQAMYGAVDLLIVEKFAGAEDVSAVSTGSQIMMTLTHLVSSLAMGLTIFLGEKIGEKDSVSGGKIIGSGMVFFHGDALAHIFANDQDVIAAAADYLKAYGIDCLLTCFLFCFIGFFNGMENTRFVMIQGIVGAFCVRVPVSFLMSRWEPVSLFRIGLATPCSTILQIALCAGFMMFTLRRGNYVQRSNF